MGNCAATYGLFRLAPKPEATEDFAPTDTSTMELEDLLRMGIAEAQEASVIRNRRERLRHIYTARGLLTAALRRCGQSDPDLCAHLFAVLLKLGEDARHVQNLMAECSGRGGGVGVAPPAGAAAGDFRSNTPVMPTASGERTPSESSEHSSENADASLRLWEYDEMRDTLLDDEDCESPMSTQASPRAPDSSQADAHEPPSRHRLSPLSTVRENPDSASSGESDPSSPSSPQELNDSVSAAGSCGGSHVEAIAAAAGASALERASSGPVASGHHHGAAAGELAGDRWGPLPQHDEGAPSRSYNARSPAARHSKDELLAGLRSLQPSAHHSGSRPSQQDSWASETSGSSGFVSDPKECMVTPGAPVAARLRAVQPQQAGGAQLHGPKRRQPGGSRSLSGVLEFGGGGTEGPQRLSAEAGPQAPSTLPSPGASAPSSVLYRHSNRRQPSQSSSSGSQGGMSDSDSSASAALAAAAGKRGGGLTPATIREEPEPMKARSRWTPHSDGEEGRVGDGYRSGGTEDLQDLASRLVPSLEKALPSSDSGVRNPLSQAELLFRNGHFSASPRNSQSLDTLSVAASCAPSAVPSPFTGGAVLRPELTPPSFHAVGSDVVSVRVLNGVSGEEEVRFSAPLQASLSEQHFLTLLDRLCQQHAGQALSGLNWLSQASPGDRFERRPCDIRMVEEIISDPQTRGSGTTVLLLCTVPVRPPSELPPGKVRLKGLVPSRVACGAAHPIVLQLDTSALEGGHTYTVAFTHQWSNMTYIAEANLLASQRGVVITVPWQMLVVSSRGITDGLYDVHLVVDGSFRSENRRTLTVGSAESELSSSSTARSTCTSSFVPIGRSAA